MLHGTHQLGANCVLSFYQSFSAETSLLQHRKTVLMRANQKCCRPEHKRHSNVEQMWQVQNLLIILWITTSETVIWSICSINILIIYLSYGYGCSKNTLVTSAKMVATIRKAIKAISGIRQDRLDTANSTPLRYTFQIKDTCTGWAEFWHFTSIARNRPILMWFPWTLGCWCRDLS